MKFSDKKTQKRCLRLCVRRRTTSLPACVTSLLARVTSFPASVTRLPARVTSLAASVTRRRRAGTWRSDGGAAASRAARPRATARGAVHRPASQPPPPPPPPPLVHGQPSRRRRRGRSTSPDPRLPSRPQVTLSRRSSSARRRRRRRRRCCQSTNVEVTSAPDVVEHISAVAI